MSLLDAYGRALPFDVERRTTDLGPFKQWMKGFDLVTPESRLSDPVKQHISCFRCINLIAQVIAHVPFELWRGDRLDIQTRARTFGGLSRASKNKSSQQVKTGPLVDLFKKPNDVMSWSKFVQTIVAHLETDGNFYILRDELTSKQIPGSLKPLNPAQITPERVKGDPFALLNWTYNASATKRIPIPVEEIAHGEYFPDPTDPLKGIGPLTVARLTVEGDYAAAVFNRSLLRRGGQPGATLTYKGKKNLDDTRREEIAEEWEKKFGASSSGNRLAVLTGDFEYTPITINPRDMQFINGREWNLKDIARAFNVPLVFLNEFDASGLGDAGLRVLYKMFYQSNIIPICNVIAEVLTEGIINPVDPNLVAIFNFDNVEALREDLKEKADVAKVFIDAGWSPNQVNERLDIGFDEMEGGDESLVASSLTTRTAIVRQAEKDIENIDNPPELPPQGYLAAPGTRPQLPAPGEAANPNAPKEPAQQRLIKQESDGWHVYSKDGSKHLGGPYSSKKKALDRLKQVEHFSNRDSFNVHIESSALLSRMVSAIDRRRSEIAGVVHARTGVK